MEDELDASFIVLLVQINPVFKHKILQKYK